MLYYTPRLQTYSVQATIYSGFLHASTVGICWIGEMTGQAKRLLRALLQRYCIPVCARKPYVTTCSNMSHSCHSHPLIYAEMRAFYSLLTNTYVLLYSSTSNNNKNNDKNNMSSTLLTAVDCKTWPHDGYGRGSRVESISLSLSLSIFDLHSPL